MNHETKALYKTIGRLEAIVNNKQRSKKELELAGWLLKGITEELVFEKHSLTIKKSPTGCVSVGSVPNSIIKGAPTRGAWRTLSSDLGE